MTAPTLAPRVALTVSGTIADNLQADIDAGLRPRADYLELARALGGADLVDHAAARRATGRVGRLVERLAGPDVLLAWACHRAGRRYDVVVTDGEQVGLPLAALSRLRVRRRRTVRHLMIVHVLSVPKKAWLHRILGLGRHIDRYLTYATWQSRFITDELGVPAERVDQTTFMVDTDFFDAVEPPAGAERTICAVGLECRDYPTLLRAVDGLDVKVVIAAASPWSKRRSTTESQAIPANVEVCQLDLFALRQLYQRSEFMVMPLDDVPFQAGVTSLLEAMASGRAVVCSRTRGQTDVVVEGETGLYVEPGDPIALRAAIVALLDDPERTRAMGRAARREAECRFELTHYAEGIARSVQASVTATTPDATPRSHPGAGPDRTSGGSPCPGS